MNRYGNRTRVAKIAMKELKESMLSEYEDVPELERYVMRYLANSYKDNMPEPHISLNDYFVKCSKYPPVNKRSSITPKEMYPELDKRIASVIEKFRKTASYKLFNGTYDKYFLTAFMYYVYAEKHPEIDLDNDVEFADCEKKPSEVIKFKLSVYRDTVPYDVKGLSDIGLATYYVYENGKLDNCMIGERWNYRHCNPSDFLSAKDVKILRESTGLSTQELCDILSAELYNAMAVRMDTDVRVTTPDTVLIYYYFYIHSVDTKVFNPSQTAVAEAYIESRLNSIGNLNTKISGIYPRNLEFIYAHAEDDYSDISDEVSSNFFQYSTIAVTNTEVRRKVLGEIRKIKDKVSKVEYTKNFYTDEWIRAYVYYTIREESVSKVPSDPVLTEFAYQVRSTLPTSLSEISKYAAVLLSLARMDLPDLGNRYYKYQDFSQLLVDDDRELLDSVYGGPDQIISDARENLSKFADVYWLKPDAGSDTIELLRRYVNVVTEYKDNHKVPLLAVVDNPLEVKKVLARGISLTFQSGMSSPTGELISGIIKTKTKKDGIGKDKIDVPVNLTEEDKEFFKRVRGWSDVKTETELHERLYTTDLFKYGIKATVDQLTVNDILRANLYAGMCDREAKKQKQEQQ